MKKGFTLVELVVVMAVMSILLVGVMSMTGPASTIAKRAKLSDSTYSIANNVENYLQRTLEYADNVWMFDSTDSRANDIPSTVREFKNAYYNHVCTGTTAGSSGNTVYVKGNIYVMHLDNSTGEIHTTAYTFPNSSHNAITAGVDTTAIAELNPAYIHANDNRRFNIRYIMGASELVTSMSGGVVERNADTDPYYLVQSERDGETVNEDYRNQAISIIVNEGEAPVSGKFEGPAVLNVANLSFTNIVERYELNPQVGHPVNMPMRRTVLKDGDEGTNNIMIQGDPTLPAELAQSDVSFINFAGQDSKPVSTSNDIYIVYSFADELQPRR
jgi:prepilin-type N-terminal cleavage/methylation domain-containing protein